MKNYTWLDQIAYGHQVATERVRAQLHNAHPWDRLPIPAHTARSLLHGCMPATIAVTSRRAQHARVMVALRHFEGTALALNQPAPDAIDAPIAAAIDLAAELGEWVRRAQWARATTHAGVSWPAPAPVTAIMRLSTAEHRTNTPDADAARRHSPQGLMAHAYQQGAHLAARAAQAAQGELALVTPPDAPDPRQIVLHLVPRAA